MTRDLLSLPEEAFDYAPRSLILQMATIDDFRKLWASTESSYSVTYGSDYYHFAPESCNSFWFRFRSVLTVNLVTGAYCWRKPYFTWTLP